MRYDDDKDPGTAALAGGGRRTGPLGRGPVARSGRHEARLQQTAPRSPSRG